MLPVVTAKGTKKRSPVNPVSLILYPSVCPAGPGVPDSKIRTGSAAPVEGISSTIAAMIPVNLVTVLLGHRI
jgi:hypothetical protein